MPFAEPETHFISGADDCKAYVWRFDKESDDVCFEPLNHDGPVTDIKSVYLEHNNWLIATAAEQTITLWSFNTLNIDLVQKLSNTNSYTLGLSLFRMPKSEQFLLAFGNDKGNICICAQGKSLSVSSSTEPNVKPFRMVHQMSGHEDWVRALDIIEDGDDILLASAAQDNFIRLWRISKRTVEQAFENKIDICNITEDDTEIRMEEKIIYLSGSNWCAISLESVLYGHEGWVYGVNWHRSKEHGNSRYLHEFKSKFR